MLYAIIIFASFFVLRLFSLAFSISEGQQVKPEAKGVRNGIRQYPEDTSPQIRNPSESIIANHTITGHPGLYAKEETRSKGLKI